MANSNFYNNFTTFQSNVRPLPHFNVPPPPPPPHFQPLPFQSMICSDQNFVNTFETKIVNNKTSRQPKKAVSLSAVREQLRNIVNSLNRLKEQEKSLQDQLEILSDTDWNERMESSSKEKTLLENVMAEINDTYLDTIKTALTKRSAKRMRLKRIKIVRRQEKEEKQRQGEEKGRHIDENLQKIKDTIDKAKQEEEFKAQADIILREVSRKKQDAKKCIAKLEAMVKLRKARENTARGRGVAVSESDAKAFNGNVEKITSLWVQKLALYETEEAVLRAKLNSDAQRASDAGETDHGLAQNLTQWKEFLFGTTDGPQVDFQGNSGHFVAVRCAWDTFISSEGSPLPVGWVVPSLGPGFVKKIT